MRRHKRVALGGSRNAVTAFAFFSLLCLAGIITLFSQTSLEETEAGRSRAGWTSLDPGSSNAAELGDLLPASIEAGARLSASPEDPAAAGEGKEPGETEKKPERKILRLR